MNKNEGSLIKHALLLYGFNCEYNISHNNHFSTIKSRYINLTIFNRYYNSTRGTNRYVIRNADNYISESAKVFTDNNIRNFINHWCEYYKFTDSISYAAIAMYDDGLYDVSFISGCCWYSIIIMCSRPKDIKREKWIFYKW